MEESFKVSVNGNEYTVTPQPREPGTSVGKQFKEQYRIETGCEYLFAIELTEAWFWRSN
jgi:hypothetical protein